MTKVVAVSSNMQSAFKDKPKKEQIRILSGLELPRAIIALMVGTTPEAVSVFLSQIKTEEKKGKSQNEELVKKDERETV